MNIRIATRKSPLALVQANEVRLRLLAAWPGKLSPEQVVLVEMTTSGDTNWDKSLAEIGGKGLFTKELEDALLAGTAEIAVHSMKDVPTVLPQGLVISCMLEREDPRDALIGQGLRSLADIPQGASFGTSSLRRAAQLLAIRPDIKIVPFRGNVQTRLRKLEEGQAVATMLAAAGLNRLGLSQVVSAVLGADVFLPAIAQGAIGIECREDNAAIRELLAPLNHRETEIAVACERAFLKVLDGSCRTPIAGYARLEGEKLHFSGFMANPDGTGARTVNISGSVANAEESGKQAAMKIRS